MTVRGKLRGRIAPRHSIEAAIACRPFVSISANDSSDGVMCNCSRWGAYIETPRAFTTGAILIVRTTRYLPLTNGEHPPSICLAEVKWRRELTDGRPNRYGFGLRYLD